MRDLNQYLYFIRLKEISMEESWEAEALEDIRCDKILM